MANICDRPSLQRWLESRPADDGRILAARAVLRVLPFLGQAAEQIGPRYPLSASQFCLAIFRAVAIPHFSALHPAEIAPTSAISWNDAVENEHPLANLAWEVQNAINTPKDVAKVVAEAAEMAICAVCSDEDYDDRENFIRDGAPRSDISRVTLSAAGAAIISSVSAFWRIIEADAEALERGGGVGQLAAEALWRSKPPRWVTDLWNPFKEHLLSRRDEHWEVWTSWYDGRLAGRPVITELELARLTEVGPEEWIAGPAIANAKINQIIARHFEPQSPALTTRRLFVSHSTQTDGGHANLLARALEAAGHSCWIAPRDIPSGADWNDAIISGLGSCDAMILLLSEAALKSPFVKAEVQHAFEKGKRVVPIRLADTTDAGKIDLRLKIVQHIDGQTGTQAIVASILKTLS